MIQQPTIERIKGEIADYYFAEDGILYSYSKPIRRTVERIKNNVELVQSITGGKPVPLLIYLCQSPVPDRETRDFSTLSIPKIYSAMAMVSKPGLSQYLMNILFKLKKPPIPMKSFVDDEKARVWLKSLSQK